MRRSIVATVIAFAHFVPPTHAQDADHVISGAVLDGISNDPVAEAWIQIKDSRIAAVTDSAGRFVLAAVSEGRYRIEVSRVGYVTQRESLSVNDDIAITVTMTPKPIVLEGIHVTLDRLAARRNAFPYGVFVFDERAIVRSSALDVGDFVERRAGLTMIPCPSGEVGCVFRRGERARLEVVIDDRPAFGGLWELIGFPLSEVDQIEVVRRCPMVRIYTKRFMEEVTLGKRRIYPVLDC
jgi:hypothetical protein